MRPIAMTLALAAAAIFAGGTWEASAADKSNKKQARATTSKQVTVPRARSSTTNADGTCKRDNGKPGSELSFRDKCDMEEFWNRFTPAT